MRKTRSGDLNEDDFPAELNFNAAKTAPRLLRNLYKSQARTAWDEKQSISALPTRRDLRDAGMGREQIFEIRGPKPC